MSLAPSERQALARIEEALRDSDPVLAAKLATFTELTRRGSVPRWKWLSPWRLRIGRLLPIGAVLAGFGLLVLVVALFAQPAHSHGPAQVSCGGAVARVAACHPAGRPAHPAHPAHPARSAGGSPESG